MVQRYLIDTCIWRDFYENRVSKSGNFLGEQAARLFVKILKRKDLILFSESLVLELGKDYAPIEIESMLSLLIVSKALFKIEISKEEHIEARKLSQKRNVPYIDCLNAVQARNREAVLVTQDAHFFENLSDVCEAARPSDII